MLDNCLLHQLLDDLPQLSRAHLAADHLDVADARTPQRFLLHRVARGGRVRAFEMPAALILDRVQRPAFLVDDQQLGSILSGFNRIQFGGARSPICSRLRLKNG